MFVPSFFAYTDSLSNFEASRFDGRDALYYVGVHFRLSERPEEALEVLKQASRHASAALQSQARKELFSLLLERGRYEETVAFARELLEDTELEGRSGWKNSDIGVVNSLCRALMVLEDYEELGRVLEEYGGDRGGGGDGLGGDTSRGDSPSGGVPGAREEAARREFFRIWHGWYRDRDGWKQELGHYMARYPVDLLPDLLYPWLGYPEGGDVPVSENFKSLDFRSLNAGAAAFVRAKLLLSLKRNREAFEEYTRYLSEVADREEAKESEPLAELFTAYPGDEFVRAVIYSGNLYGGLQSISKARRRVEEATRGATRGDGGTLFWFLETEAYLQRRLGRYTNAMALYDRALELAPSSQKERMRWYRYDSLMRIDRGGAVDELMDLTNEWEDPQYYDDVLFDLADRLVRARRWESIAKAANILVRHSRSVAAGRYAYLAGRAAELGFYTTEEAQIRFWYEQAVRSGCGAGSANYYRIMASERLKVMDGEVGAGRFSLAETEEEWWPFCTNNSVDFDELPSPEKEKKILLAADTAKLISGYVGYGLSDYAYELYGDERETLGALSRFTLRRWARELQKKKSYLESIRLMSRYYEATGKAIHDEDVRLLYPRAYESMMEGVSDRYGFPDYLLFALVREESLFSAGISSSAGAVGLAQLMPSTAEDVASRTGKRITDLTEPSLNLSLGGWYLDHLIGRTESYSQALFSYNGGITRVRRWVRENSDLPGDLFLEAIPFKETSHYGRKVLVSAVVYGYIYHNIGIREIVESFFETKRGGPGKS